jgi:hypothetical protein
LPAPLSNVSVFFFEGGGGSDVAQCLAGARWKGVLKPRHFLGAGLAVMTMSWISSSDIWSTRSTCHGAHGSQQGVLSEGGIIVESVGLAQRRFDTSAAS